MELMDVVWEFIISWSPPEPLTKILERKRDIPISVKDATRHMSTDMDAVDISRSLIRRRRTRNGNSESVYPTTTSSILIPLVNRHGLGGSSIVLCCCCVSYFI